MKPVRYALTRKVVDLYDAPATKLISVWHVEFMWRPLGSEWVPGIALREDYQHAAACRESLNRQPSKYACVYITGPHQHRVTA